MAELGFFFRCSRWLLPLLVLGCGGSQAAPAATEQPTCPEPETVEADREVTGSAEAEHEPETAHPLGSLQRRSEVRQQWLQQRLTRVLPGLMRKHGVDMWIVLSREYNEDPVFFSLVGPDALAARRRTILVFFDRGPEQGVERLALGGGSHGGLYEVYRDPEVEDRELWGEVQWKLLRKLVEQRKPERIAINESAVHAFADGLTASQKQALHGALGPWAKRTVPADELAVQYIESRPPEMLPEYTKIMKIAHDIIARAFSNEVIVPGETTNHDVQWWMWEQVRALGLRVWFPPHVDVQRPEFELESYLAQNEPVVIQPGDVLHCDFGIVAMGLATDTQHLGYVLDEGETEPPPGLVEALKRGNRLQDIMLEELRPGRTGNEVLKAARAKMTAEDIDGSIYSHPVGDHGHGAGPLIGLWDRQQGVPGRGDLVVRKNTWFSVELQATSPLPVWDGHPVRAALEEDVVVDQTGDVRWILPRQEQLHLVR